MSRNHDRPRQVKYVYDLPYTEREKLCKILDINNCWEKLGGKYMDFTVTELNAIRLVEKCGESPTNRLLQLWGQQNHTLMQLFNCLWKMEHFQALRALQPCIDEKYHTLFLNDERNITEPIRVKRPGGIIVKNPGLGESDRQDLVHPNPYGTPPYLSYRMDVPHNMPNQYSTPPHPKPNTTVNHGIVINQHTVSPSFSKAMHPTPGNSHLQDGGASLEGAYALSPTHIPASHHGAHNFNQGSPYPPSYTASPKVPAALLYSSQSVITTQQGATVAGGMQHSVSGAAGVMTGTVGMKQGIAGTGGMKYSVAGGMDQNMTGTGGMKHSMTGLGGMNQTVAGTGGMKQGMAGPGDLRASVTGIGDVRHTVSSSQYPQPTSPLVQEPSRKINNYEDIGGNGFVSCEDNTGAGYNTTEKERYDPSQDYMNRLKEKEAKEAARQAEEAGLNHSTNPVSLTLTQSSAPNNFHHPAPASPPTPSPQPTSDMYPKNAAAAAAPPSRKVSSSSCSSSTDGGPGGCSSSVPVIPYKELEEATNSWNQHNLLGRGGFGAVFKGIWKNTEVAVKRIEPHGNASHDDTRLHISQSLEELKLLQSYRHDNILQVYGYSMDHEQYPCLVYQFMPNGSVEDRLQGRKIEALGVSGVSGWSSSCGSWSQQGLTWIQRYRVAWGTAKALQFLHTVKDKPLIHGDVKSANILLDQNYEPKLGDFGLAREGKSQSTSIKVSRVHGTKPYLPDDYLRHKKLSVKVDTYSYGVVLFELCTGLRAYDEKRKGGTKLLRDLVEETAEAETLRDSSLGGRPDDGIFHFLYKLGKKCVHTLSTKRPDMKAVFEELGKFAMLLEGRAQARRISQGDSSSGCSTPHHLQVCYDTAGSIHGHSPTPSPSLQPPSFPNFHPSSPSAISPLPPSPSPVSPAHSPAPPSHFPHPAPHFTPQYPGRPTLQFCPHPTSHYPPGAVLRQGGQISPGAHYPPRFMPHLQVSLAGHDPPTYSETMSQGPGVVAGMMAGAGAVGRPGMMPRMRLPAVGSALVPDFATLNMNDTSYSSESSNYVDSDSSLAASTTHNIGVRQDPPQSSPGNMMPLLTALGTKDDDASIVLPTAASKTFTLK